MKPKFIFDMNLLIFGYINNFPEYKYYYDVDNVLINVIYEAKKFEGNIYPVKFAGKVCHNVKENVAFYSRFSNGAAYKLCDNYPVINGKEK